MSDQLLDKVRELVLRVLRDEEDNPGRGCPPIDRIAAILETALALRGREAYVEGWAEAWSFHNVPESERNRTFAEYDSVTAFPLPTRTRQVLREESVPGAGGPVYRWNPHFGGAGRFEVRDMGGLWCPRDVHSYEGVLLRHALDLHDNPSRTEEVPGDEADPWGEGLAENVGSQSYNKPG